MVVRATVLVMLATQAASAGPHTVSGGSPRAIGRAGVGTVSDDGGGALQVNPAGIARRDAWRVQIGIGFLDDATSWLGDDPVDGEPRVPLARDQAGSAVLPHLAVMGSFGDWMVGAAAMTSAISDRALRDPALIRVDEDKPPRGWGQEAVRNAFLYRYAGIEGLLRRDALLVGVARRVGDSVAIGLSTGVTRIAAREMRRMWVGFEGVVPVGAPRRDLQVVLEGDALVPLATVGALIAPEDTPMELGISVGWVKRPELHGTIGSVSTGLASNGAPSLIATDPTARLIVRQPIAVHAGARYVGEKFSIELGGDVFFASQKARKVAWELTGVRVQDAPAISSSIVETELDGVPSRVSLRTHGAIRGAVDVEIVPGFLYATAGYAFAIGATTEARLSPTFADLGGHTVALGIEGTQGGVTYTIGWSRTIAQSRYVDSELQHDNPFAAGDAVIPSGRYDASVDQIGVLLDLEIAAP